jgi:hypothetical protein
VSGAEPAAEPATGAARTAAGEPTASTDATILLDPVDPLGAPPEPRADTPPRRRSRRSTSTPTERLDQVDDPDSTPPAARG